ncbi:MAG: hypothetical protein ACXACI_07545 [Candidatus Hodarchaeales archaeon]|jgi:hypothetical protein
MQQKGISATHPILVLRTEDETVVCSVASREGNSSFDYSLLLPPDVISPSITDDEAISAICRSENHRQSAWGWELAMHHGVTQEEIQDVFPLIEIPNPRAIRLSRATRNVQSHNSEKIAK